MTELFVAKAAEFKDGEAKIVFHKRLEIGVFQWQGAYYAYRNLCPHQGGPACEGISMHKVVDVIHPDKTWHGQRFSPDQIHFVCPWHGWEFDMKTGKAIADPEQGLKSYPVARKGDDVFVTVD